MKVKPYQYEEKTNNFVVPAGIYRARLRTAMEITHPKNGDHDDLRLLFDIVADEDGPVDYCIRKLYCPKGDGYSEYGQDTEAFFTDDEYAEIEKAGEPIAFSELVGKYVDLIVVTKKVKGFKFPFSMIARMFFPGTLIQDPAVEKVIDEDSDDEPSSVAA